MDVKTIAFDGKDERFELTDEQKEKTRTALKEDIIELERLWLKVFGEPLNLPYIL